ncbi:DUF3267 domain-containing protein [Enterococcus raffinosus]|uniref:DUF3267 domain-containing protein n=1 Tax=Enterococcus raffinosus TaxID=71452 RepID=UPI001C10E57A|nr:DUF3267 domain-containing protein [Enterococcus raffinosus]MBU5363624.1 DUF3267 domain-containing protein [Enterococcus raffinosus]
MEKHQEDFKNMKAALLQEGYKEKDVTFTAKKAILLGLLYSLPFIAILGLIYRFLLVGGAHLTEITGASFYLTFFAIIIISTVIHELLHGFGWAFSSGYGWKAVRFNINALMPSYACRSALEKRQYLIGVLLPLTVLGTISALFLVIYPGTISFFIMIINFILAGADLIIAFNVLKEENSLIIDHPVEAGYIAFYK